MLMAVRPVCTACKWVVMGVGWREVLGTLYSWAPSVLAFGASHKVAG